MKQVVDFKENTVQRFFNLYDDYISQKKVFFELKEKEEDLCSSVESSSFSGKKGFYGSADAVAIANEARGELIKFYKKHAKDLNSLPGVLAEKEERIMIDSKSICLNSDFNLVNLGAYFEKLMGIYEGREYSFEVIEVLSDVFVRGTVKKYALVSKNAGSKHYSSFEQLQNAVNEGLVVVFERVENNGVMPFYPSMPKQKDKDTCPIACNVNFCEQKKYVVDFVDSLIDFKMTMKIKDLTDDQVETIMDAFIASRLDDVKAQYAYNEGQDNASIERIKEESSQKVKRYEVRIEESRDKLKGVLSQYGGLSN